MRAEGRVCLPRRDDLAKWLTGVNEAVSTDMTTPD